MTNCRPVAPMQRKPTVCAVKTENTLQKYLHLSVFCYINSFMLFVNNTLHGAELAVTDWGNLGAKTVRTC
jgi:hypothetical protein